jgi:mannosyltransferase
MWSTKARPFMPFGLGFGVMLLAAGTSLTNVALDWDEGATLSAATRSLTDLARLASYKDAVITPFYLVIHFTIRLLGESDTALRLPSLLAMAAGAGVTAELGRRIAGQAAGILAGLFCAAIPSLILYAQTARPYGFAFLFATLSTLALLTAVATPTWWRWAGYAACVALTGMFHLVALSVLSGHVAILAMAWWKDRDQRLWRAVAALGLALTALLPLLWLGKGQHNSQLHWVETPTWETLVKVPGDIASSPAVGYLLAGLAVAAYAALPSRRYAELVAVIALPVLTVMAVSQIAPVWVPRYGIFLLAPMAVLGAATVTSDHVRSVAVSRTVRAIAIGASLVLLSLPAQIAVRSARSAPDTRAMAAAIHDMAQPDDVVVYGDFAWTIRPTLMHYLGELNWSGTAQPADVLLKRTAAMNGTLESTEFNDVQGRLKGAGRIWLIGLAPGVYGAPKDPLTGPGWKIKYIGQNYDVGQSFTYSTGRLVLLVPRSTAAAAG